MRIVVLLSLLLVVVGCNAREFVDVDQDDVVQGEPGPRGLRGERGLQGPAWKPTTYVVQEFVELEPGAYDEAFAECEPGDVAMNGGCQWGDWINDREAVVRPYLSIGLGQAEVKDAFSGWLCSGTSEETEALTRVYTTVTCLVVSP